MEAFWNVAWRVWPCRGGWDGRHSSEIGPSWSIVARVPVGQLLAMLFWQGSLRAESYSCAREKLYTQEFLGPATCPGGHAHTPLSES